jgi:hypothetical protein
VATKVTKLISQKEFEERSRKLGEELAKDFRRLLISNIESNKYGFSISDATLSRRINGSKTPLIDTGEYLDAVIVEGTVVTVKNGQHSSGLSYYELSDILEYGRLDKSVPAFPVWSMTYEEFKPEAEKRIREEFEDITVEKDVREKSRQGKTRRPHVRRGKARR